MKHTETELRNYIEHGMMTGEGECTFDIEDITLLLDIIDKYRRELDAIKKVLDQFEEKK